MTTDGTEYLIRCHAYSKGGQRCEQLAGHDGNHALVTEWTDEECWTPGDAPVIPPTVVHIGREEMTEHLVDIPKPSGKCVICGHKMHDRMCGSPDADGFDCNCSAGVEE